MKKTLITLAALVFVAGPSVALAHPVTMAHQRPNLFHDRSPRAHVHISFAHH